MVDVDQRRRLYWSEAEMAAYHALVRRRNKMIDRRLAECIRLAEEMHGDRGEAFNDVGERLRQLKATGG